MTAYMTFRFYCPAIPEFTNGMFCSARVEYTEARSGGTVDIDEFTQRAHIYAQARHGWVPRRQLQDSGVNVWVDTEQQEWLICPDCTMAESGINASVLDARCPTCDADVGERCNEAPTHQSRWNRRRRIRRRVEATA